MTYEIEFTTEARMGLAKLERSEPKAFMKAVRFIEELREHPETGIGHPEPLKGQPEGRWSRQITKKHRMVYQILKEEVVVLVLRSYGHYNDK
ncbi:MAG: Txe/YoeB family addiction module toxin [Prevotella sp.]|nr:Txe/YoeB family addiction module toxin [Prevotella sp.]MCR5068805.1 Txe/YoeB family addiction module toxin [Prevotella sp.]